MLDCADELAEGLFKSLTVNAGFVGAMPGGPSDIVTVGLASSTSPYNLVALPTETVNGGTLQGRYYFGGAVANGTSYYLIAINRNHLTGLQAIACYTVQPQRARK